MTFSNQNNNNIITTPLAAATTLFTVAFLSGFTTYFLSKKLLNNNDNDNDNKSDKFIPGSSYLEASGIGKRLPFMGEAGGYGQCVYLDYNATTPVFPEIYEAMKPYISNYFANAVSAHVYADPCKEAIKTARKEIGKLFNILDPENEFIFTSCGTESDNLAIHMALHHYSVVKNRVKFIKNDDDEEEHQESSNSTLPVVITSTIEHPAVLKFLRRLQDEKKLELIVIPVDQEGKIQMELIKKNLSRRVALVSIMHSNNEIGTIQPIRLISRLIQQFNKEHKTEILLHSDASQSSSKVHLDVLTLGVDFLTIAGQKYGGMKGCSGLYVKESVEKTAMIVGGHQERGLRGGTENVVASVSLGKASLIAYNELNYLIFYLLMLKIKLIERLEEYFQDKFTTHIRFNGPVENHTSKSLKTIYILMKSCASNYSSSAATSSSLSSDIASTLTQFASALSSDSPINFSSSFFEPSNSKAKEDLSSFLSQLPNTVSVSFKDLNGHQIMTRLREKVAVSAGAACASADDPTSCANLCESKRKALMSQVLQAIDVPSQFGLGTLRLSYGRHTTVEEIEFAAKQIYETVTEMWKEKEIN